MAAPPDVALGPAARSLRALPLHERGGRRAPRDLARRLRVLLAPRRPGARRGWRSTCCSRWCRSRSPAPLLIPLLDRAGPRRAISFAAAAGRALAALYAAPRVGTLVLFPAALVLLVLSKVHAITKNGLTTAYAPPEEGLMRANARLGRIAVGGSPHGGTARIPVPEDLGRERSDLSGRGRLRDLGRAQPPAAEPAAAATEGATRGRSARADPGAHRSGDRRGRDAGRERVPALPPGDLAPRRAASRCGGSASWPRPACSAGSSPTCSLRGSRPTRARRRWWSRACRPARSARCSRSRCSGSRC